MVSDAEDPVAEDPLAEDPVAEDPVAEDPVAEDPVDWVLAASLGRRLAKASPDVSYAEAADVVASLLRHAEAAEGHVRRTARLEPDPSTPPPPPVLVVDRGEWVRRNAEGMRAASRPLLEVLLRKAQEKGRQPGALDAVATSVGRRVTAVQLASLLAFLSSRVLGQYEVFRPLPDDAAGRPAGTLLLVAPNLVHAEREMGVDPEDFRLWVCLHEVTHRLQFAASPWLADHVEAQVAAFAETADLELSTLLSRLRAASADVVGALRGTGDTSLLEIVQSPEQREVLDRVQGFMSLVEGHAEWVMDAVGPEVVPSLQRIRAAVQRRRGGQGPLDLLVRRLLGLDLKMRQYADGRRFVEAVVDEVGVDAFNRVWESPETLPTRAEIADPPAWVRRVVGPGTGGQDGAGLPG